MLFYASKNTILPQDSNGERKRMQGMQPQEGTHYVFCHHLHHHHHGHLCAPGLGKGGINPQVWAHACRRVNCEQVMADTDKLNINSLNQWLLQMRRSKPHKDVWLQGDQKKRTVLKVLPNLSQSAHPTRTWSIAQNSDDTHRQYLDLSQLLEYGGFPLESKL